jgi:hypothetical protein
MTGVRKASATAVSALDGEALRAQDLACTLLMRGLLPGMQQSHCRHRAALGKCLPRRFAQAFFIKRQQLVAMDIKPTAQGRGEGGQDLVLRLGKLEKACPPLVADLQQIAEAVCGEEGEARALAL